MESRRHGIIIGGGVIGLACAYYLTQCGWRVTVLDRGEIGKGCSHGNCGLVCPSHVLPLAEPGVVWQGLKAMLAPNGPFSIKPRLDFGLWSWLWQFARRCNHHDMLASAHSLQPLLESSRRLYNQLMAAEPLECEWQTRGLLFVFRSQAAMASYAATDRLLRERFHTPAMPYKGAALQELEPALQPGLAGGWYYEHDAHLRPDRLIASWQALLVARGVTFREQTELQGFQPAQGRAAAAETDRGSLAGDVFIVACGAWTPLLARLLGQRIPIQPGKGYSLTMPRPAICPSIPMLLPEDRVAVTPMQSGYRLGSVLEFSGYDPSLPPRRVEYLQRAAARYLREPIGEPIQEQWCGWRPMTYDSLPIIDRVPGKENVFVAAGHSTLGLTLAPATGKLVAELVNGRQPHVDPVAFSLRRFFPKPDQATYQRKS